MKVSTRKFENVRHLILVAETEQESLAIDSVMGAVVGEDGHIAGVSGEVKLGDGFREHYIRLTKLPD
jgi:hypothetical protein